MPNYDFVCSDCGTSDEKFFHMADIPREVDCECGGCMAQDFSQIANFAIPHGWTDGKLVPQIHPKDKDTMVTSKSEMERVYEKHGLCRDTGTVLDKKRYDRHFFAHLPEQGNPNRYIPERSSASGQDDQGAT